VTNPTDPAKGIVRFYNGRATCEQWIREGRHAVEWMRLPCHQFKDNAVRLAVFVLAYSLANSLRRLALPQQMASWGLTSLREKLVRIGATPVRQARRPVLQMAEVAVTRDLFGHILTSIALLSPVPTRWSPRLAAMAPPIVSFLPGRKCRHASCRACQQEQGTQTVTTGGNTQLSQPPRPDVQVSEAQMAKCRSECLTVQPTTRVPSLI